MSEKKFLKIGIIGTIVTAICCFTPFLMWILATIGLPSIIIYLDIVLLPALAIFIFMTGYALWKRTKS